MNSKLNTALDRVIEANSLTYHGALDALDGEAAMREISLDDAPLFVAEAISEGSDDELQRLYRLVLAGDHTAAGEAVADMLNLYAVALLEQRLLDTTDVDLDDAAEVDADVRAAEARAINAERGL